MTGPQGYTLRAATAGDAELIAAQRERMFIDMGVRYTEAGARFAPWVQPRLQSGDYLGWLAEAGGAVVAGAGLLLLDWPPHFADPQPLRSYLLNVYVEPGHRGRGLARHLTEQAMAETRRRHIRVMSLHASEAGRPVYEKLGFAPTNELRIVLEAQA